MAASYHRSEDEWKEVLESITHRPIPKDGKQSMYRSSHYTSSMLINCGVIRPCPEAKYDVVDIGCGNGRLAISLCETKFRYLGIEVVPGCIEWANKAFEPWRNISFAHLDVFNPSYNPFGRIKADDVLFPCENEVAGAVIFNSVFTHFEDIIQCERYLREANRILVPTGRGWLTWFRSPPNKLNEDDKVNTDRAVFLENDILNVISQAGFKIISSFGGTTCEFSDQWQMIVEKVDTTKGGE